MPNHSPLIRILFLLVAFVTSVGAQVRPTSDITADELRAHVKYLASDELKGRRAGTHENDLAAQYIIRQFKSSGLTPMGTAGDYLQPFEFVAGVKVGPGNALSYSHAGKPAAALTVNRAFRPLGFSASGSFTGPVVFVGYGLSIPDKNYDDYSGMDVKDKAVLLFRMAPPIDSTRGALDMVSSLRYKASKAHELGAKALLVVTGPADSDTLDDLMKLSYDQSMGDAGLLAVNLTREAANTLLRASGKTVKGLQDEIIASRKPHSIVLEGLSLSVSADVQTIKATSANVVGYLEGSDPAKKNEVVIIGAHFDHLGMGGEGSLKPDTVAIHPGADDNASGTAGLLELAQYFGAHRSTLKRSLLFISFTGEELGLLGSGYYVKNPTVPLEQCVTMINMDMIGRLTNRTLIVYGVGTSPAFDSLVRAHDADSAFVLKLNKDGLGPSDQSSFYGKQMPVFHFFTDLHSDYHRPEDTWDKINYPGMESVVRFVQGIATALDTTSRRPTYVAVEMPRQSGNVGRSTRVWVGTVPDFGEQADGMKISGVREGSPAAKAGMKGGDIIVKFGKVDIRNIYDFTYAIGEYKVGDVVPVVVKRGNETRTFEVTLERRPN